MQRKFSSYNITVYFITVLLLIFIIFPIMWMFSTSLKLDKQILSTPPTWVPKPITFEKFRNVLFGELDAKVSQMYGAAQQANFAIWFKNSLMISGAATLIAIISGIGAAYAFSRFRFALSNLFLIFIMMGYFLPQTVVLVPLFQILNKFGLINTRFALILTHQLILLPMVVWVLRGHFDKIPKELEEAAYLDGCSRFSVLIRIILPICSPGILSTAVLAFVFSWEEYLFALVYTSDPNLFVVSLGLSQYKGDVGFLWGELMAAALLATLPIVFLFWVVQRNMISGLAAGALKG